MKLLHLLAAALFTAATVLPVAPAAAQLPVAVDGEALPSLAPMLQRTVPAVVNISTRGTVQTQRNPMFNDPFFRRFFSMPDQPQEREVASLGSGVIVDAERGLVLTNNHVVANATEIRVTLQDGRELVAEVVGTDEGTDVALLKVEGANLTALPMSNSDALEVGDFVVAIGNPFGLGQTVTSGIVSGLGRALLMRGPQSFEDFIQTDAAINRGNSGGALVNLRGELVGINTAILSGTGGNIGIGFAIPANMARYVMEQLLEHGEVRRGVLGINIQNLDAELAEALGTSERQGVVVTNVAEGSSAEEAGIRAGDVIISVNGRAVTHWNELRNQLGMIRVGERVRLEVIRDGERRTVNARIGELATAEVAADTLHPGLRGATFSNIPETSPLFGRVQGAQVTSVEPGSAAARARLQPEDVITTVNRQDVGNVDDLRRLAAPGQPQLLLTVRRGNGVQFIVIR
ncbi:MAG: DegQ family serine endoprotease [Xanthomonadaceae bacterium]|nr:DegQ family serine endoprotease [Xanthomonadaceae bacterium]